MMGWLVVLVNVLFVIIMLAVCVFASSSSVSIIVLVFDSSKFCLCVFVCVCGTNIYYATNASDCGLLYKAKICQNGIIMVSSRHHQFLWI